jgi:hypothetical protein
VLTGPAARTPAESPQSPDAPWRARRRSPGEQDSACGAIFSVVRTTGTGAPASIIQRAYALSERAISEVGTGVGTARANTAPAAHLTRVTMRFPLSHAERDGRTWD